LADGQAFGSGEFYEELSNAGHLAGYKMTHRFYEIGSFEGLAETNRLLSTSPAPVY
jgi:hypothetical protein